MSKEDDFSKRVEGMSGYLYKQALNFTGDSDKAKDLRQDTMLRMLLNRDKFQDIDLRAWGTKILRHLFYNDEKRLRLTHAIFYDKDDDIGEVVSYNMGQEGNPEYDFERAQFEKEFTQLDDKYRIPLELKLKGYSSKEICEMTQLTEGTLKNRLFRGKQILFERLGKNRLISLLLVLLTGWCG